MELQIQLHDINDELPLDGYTDSHWYYTRCLVWGVWDEDEPRPYMKASAVRYHPSGKKWCTLRGTNFMCADKIQYWSYMPDFDPNSDIKILKTKTEETEETDTPLEEFEEILKRRQPPKHTPVALEEMLAYLAYNKYIDEESLLYNEDKYPFSMDEYLEVFKFLDHRNNKEILVDGSFPEYVKCFSYEGIQFSTSLFIGQGSIIQFSLKEHSDNWDDALIYHVPRIKENA